MRIAVIGSTGATGRHVLTQGIHRGHQITAFTRRPETLQGVSGLAEIASGDGRDHNAVRQAVRDRDAVIAIIGASSRKGPHQTADVARSLMIAMSEEDVARLVITSAYPVVAEKPRIPLAVVTRIFAAVYADATAMEQIVSASDLEWTIVRPTRLTDGPPKGRMTITPDLLDKAPSVTRADVATALLDIVSNGALKQTAVNLAGG